jgi:hypothetical protein
MANFEFIPIPPCQTDSPDTSTLPLWNNGKINIDDWSLNINTPENHKTPIGNPNDEGWTEKWTAIPIEDWNTPNHDELPSPPSSPPFSSRQSMEPNHAGMHWSFCRLHDCQFHRGENSWYY